MKKDRMFNELYEECESAGAPAPIAYVIAVVMAFNVRVWHGGRIESIKELREEKQRRSGYYGAKDAPENPLNRPGGWNQQRTMVIAAFVGLFLVPSTLYQVQPQETGVVVRWGRFDRTSTPGLHMKMPIIETVYKVPVQRQLKLEFGFRTNRAGVRTTYRPENDITIGEATMLTGDLNVAVVEWTVQYRAADPYLYLFRVRNREATFRDMNEAMMRQLVGDRTVTEVLTVGRQEIESFMQERLQAKVDQYEMGITIDQVVLQDVNPPDPVKPSWDEVNQAQQQRDRMINEARARYNQVIPRAHGEAQQTVLQAEGYALDRVNRAAGEAARFRSIEAAYSAAPRVTRQRLYLETMQRVLPKLGRKLYIDEDATGVLPLLTIDGQAAVRARNSATP